MRDAPQVILEARSDLFGVVSTEDDLFGATGQMSRSKTRAISRIQRVADAISAKLRGAGEVTRGRRVAKVAARAERATPARAPGNRATPARFDRHARVRDLRRSGIAETSLPRSRISGVRGGKRTFGRAG